MDTFNTIVVLLLAYAAYRYVRGRGDASAASSGLAADGGDADSDESGFELQPDAAEFQMYSKTATGLMPRDRAPFIGRIGDDD